MINVSLLPNIERLVASPQEKDFLLMTPLTGIFLATLGNPLPVIPLRLLNIRILTLACATTAFCFSAIQVMQKKDLLAALNTHIFIILASSIAIVQHYYLPPKLVPYLALDIASIILTLINTFPLVQKGHVELIRVHRYSHRSNDWQTALAHLI